MAISDFQKSCFLPPKTTISFFSKKNKWERVTKQEALDVTVPCTTLIARANRTANFTLRDNFDIVLYCYAVHVGIVTSGTVELNINQFNHVVSNSKIITEAQRSMLLDPHCTDFVDCFLQRCNVAINQLGVIIINQTQGYQRLLEHFPRGFESRRHFLKIILYGRVLPTFYYYKT